MSRKVTNILEAVPGRLQAEELMSQSFLTSMAAPCDRLASWRDTMQIHETQLFLNVYPLKRGLKRGATNLSHLECINKWCISPPYEEGCASSSKVAPEPSRDWIRYFISIIVMSVMASVTFRFRFSRDALNVYSKSERRRTFSYFHENRSSHS